jgi:ferredoxin
MPSFAEQKIPGGYERIGFVFPVYVAGLPSCVEKFITEKDFQLCKNTYISTVATYGGSSGNSINRMNELIKNKGIILNSGYSVKMFANYVALYDMAKDSHIIHKNSQKPINAIAEEIKNKDIMQLSKKSNKLFHFFNKLIVKGFYEKDKGYNISENCSSCGLCSSVCPVNNIEITHGKPKP